MAGGDVAVRLHPSVLCRRAAEATGRAGDVYLCHPFIVHTATWPHRGTTPRMMAQPAAEVRDGFTLDGSDQSPVAQAIVQGLALPAAGAAQTGTAAPRSGRLTSLVAGEGMEAGAEQAHPRDLAVGRLLSPIVTWSR